ncbi:DUF3344 domain-containing protein [Methanobrevibacter sp.]|uniref:DUF3344 domain-containing protein n=1 Tax=Methanobrevibacter sp. TaxID=66852 RepID=UPI00386B415F
MKFKRIILITFILFVILTMGAVNASDNTTSDNLTANDDLNIESPVKEVKISEDNSLLSKVQNDDEIDATNQDKLSSTSGTLSDSHDEIGNARDEFILTENYSTNGSSVEMLESMYLSESGVVSGDAKVISVNPWSISGSLQYTIPNDVTNIKSAIVVVTSYAGSGNSDTYALHSDVTLTTGSTVVLGSEDLTYTGNQASDPTVYVINNHATKQYSDYQCVYNITDAISSLSPGSSFTIDVSNSEYGSYQFNGKIKMIALFFAYDDGDNDNITYWLEVGQSWTNSEKSETINTSSYTGPIDDFTLETIAVSTVYAQTYKFNGQTLASPTEISKGNYYIDAYWDSENHSLSDYFTQGSDLEFSFAAGYSSYKTVVLLLTEREIFIPDIAVDSMTTQWTSGIFDGIYAGINNNLTININNQESGAVANVVVEVVSSEGNAVIATKTIDSLASGVTTLVVNDPTVRPITAQTVNGQYDSNLVNYTVNVKYGNVVVDSKTYTKVIAYNGYLGKNYAYPGLNQTFREYSFVGEVIIVNGNNYSSNMNTTLTDVLAVALDDGSVKEALLYVPYNWDKVAAGDFNSWDITFNGHVIAPISSYRDQTNLGTYGGYGYGLVVYNVTGLVVDGSNSFALNKEGGNVAVYPSSLIVMVDNPAKAVNNTVYIVEEADLLGTSYSNNLDVSYSTAFGTVDGDAILYVFAASAQNGEGNLVINGNVYANVWSGTSSSTDVFTADVDSGNVTVKFEATASTILALQQMVVVQNDLPVVNSTNIVTQDTYSLYFNQEDNGKLFDYVPEGATLDFQGSIINSNQANVIQMNINKPVNIISSTHDAYIDLNNTASSLLGESPANSFAITNGGSGTNVTGIRFHNTQLWIANAHNVVLDNISYVIENQKIGSGVGAIGVRANCTYVIIKNSYISIRENGGYPIFEMAWADYCTFDNNTIIAEGNVGNMIYLTTLNVDIPSDVVANIHNNITNNRVYSPNAATAISWAIVLSGSDNLIENNTVEYEGNGITTQFALSSSPHNNVYRNNVLLNGSSMNVLSDSTLYNNTISGALTVGADATAYNNTVDGKVTVNSNAHVYNNTFNSGLATSGDDAIIENNTIVGAVTINKIGTAFRGNDVNGSVTVSASDNWIRNNNIVSTGVGIVVRSDIVTIRNNTVKSGGDYSIDVGDYNVIVENNYLTCKNKAGNRAVLGSNNADILGNAPLNFIVPNEYSAENIQSVFDNANEGDTIIFSGYYLIKDAVFIINKPIIIEGDNATFDANYSSIMFYINASNVIFRNIIFANVNSSDNCTIYWAGDDGSMLDCSFVNCAAGSGGAIYWRGNNGNVSGCSFVNCAAETGGAIYWTGNNGVVSKCSFVDCSADNGGAIYWAGNNGKMDKLSLTCSDENIAAVYITKDDVTVSNSKIMGSAGNINAAIHGGKVSNCTFTNKVAPVVDISVNNIQYGENETVNVALPSDATGHVNLTLLKDDEIIFTCLAAINGGFASHEFSNLNMGAYKINIYYGGSSNYREISKTVGFTVGPIVDIAQGRTVGDDVSIFMDFGCNVTDQIILKVNNRIYVLDIEEGVVNSSFSSSKLIAGNHTVTFGYYYVYNDILKDLFGENNPSPIKYNLHLLPKEVTIEKTFKSNDEGIVVIPFPENATGTVEVFVDGVKEIVVEIVDGIAKIDLSKYKDGNYNIEFRYSGDEVYAGFTKDALVNVHVKVAKITAGDLKMLYTSNTKYSVKVYGGDGKLVSGVKVTFLINNKAYKTATTGSNGVASIALSQIPGTYKITAKAASVSVTKKLTVNHLLTLKSVKVKKSAKKLVLTATLKKVNGKYLKKKKVTFKFNGKKYTAKTNKKGVAKVTIKSKVLKKLKVGKKVKYQATYLKDTVKKTVKVKK